MAFPRLSRARSIRLGIAAVVGVLCLAVASAVPFVPPTIQASESSPAARTVPAAESEFLRLTNETRVAHGLRPLRDDAELDRFSRDHSREMSDSDRLHHSDLDRIPDARRVSENVGRGGEVEPIHEAFMESPAHREVVLEPSFVELGVGVMSDGDALWATLTFRLPFEAARPAGPPVVDADVAGDSGYRLLTEEGDISVFGDAEAHEAPAGADSRSGASWSGPAVAVATSPSDSGSWVLHEDGRVVALAAAEHHGGLDDVRQDGDGGLDVRAVAMAPTPSGDGYWILDRAGGVFTFGDAGYHGSIPALVQDGRFDGVGAPAVDLVPTPSGDGYWILDESGGVFTFGDADFHGSVPTRSGDGAVATAMAVAAGIPGYWILDESGAVHAFGSVRSDLSAERAVADGRAVDLLAADPDRLWVVAGDGRVVNLGNARYEGSLR